MDFNEMKIRLLKEVAKDYKEVYKNYEKLYQLKVVDF